MTRDRLRRWLAALHWPADQAEDAVMAASEAVSNSIEHAYPPGAVGHISVCARVVVEPASSARRVVLTIQDQGTWKPARGNDAPRHGIALMRGCTEHLSIDRSDYGTTVNLRSRAVIAPTANSRYTGFRHEPQQPRATGQSSA